MGNSLGDATLRLKTTKSPPLRLKAGHLLSYHRRPSSRYSNRRDRHLCKLGGGAGCKGLGMPADGDEGGIRVLLISTKRAK
jgi:hypothetical protein